MFDPIKRFFQMSHRVFLERGFFIWFSSAVRYFRDMISLPLKKGDILFIYGIPGMPMVYRCNNIGEELSLYNFKSKTISSRNFFLRFYVRKYRLFVFHRVVCTQFINSFIQLLKLENKTIIIGMDDLVYDPTFIKSADYYVNLTESEKNFYKNGISRELFDDKDVKFCLVSTDYLKKQIVSKYPDKDVFVIYNRLGSMQLRLASKFYRNFDEISKGKISIGYFSGSKSHDRDFESIHKSIIKILSFFPHVCLKIIGILKLPSIFDDYLPQVEAYKFVSLKKLQSYISRVDVNVAPLILGDPFCESKSAIKYIESGIFGVPTIASATDSFCRIIKNGRNGFLARKSADWEKYLNLLIKNQSLRKKIGEKAKSDVVRNFTTLKKHSDSLCFALHFNKTKND